jgi:hypothetical protein
VLLCEAIDSKAEKEGRQGKGEVAKDSKTAPSFVEMRRDFLCVVRVLRFHIVIPDARGAK